MAAVNLIFEKIYLICQFGVGVAIAFLLLIFFARKIFFF